LRVAIYNDVGVSGSCAEGFKRAVSHKSIFLYLLITGKDLADGMASRDE
jgi:hypothetical protein